MKGNPEVLTHLNRLLADEFCAIHTYVLHSEMCENWGYRRLAGLILKGAMEEMKHAESHIERLLFLDAIPDVYTLERQKVGANVKELLATEHEMEKGAIAAYNQAIRVAEKVGDNGSREMFERILKEEEEHALFLESQLEQIQAMGLAGYLAEQLKGG
jgi:bacterioferritin